MDKLNMDINKLREIYSSVFFQVYFVCLLYFLIPYFFIHYVSIQQQPEIQTEILQENSIQTNSIQTNFISNDVIYKLAEDIFIKKREQDIRRHNNIMTEDGFKYVVKIPIKELDNIHVSIIIYFYEKKTGKYIDLNIDSSRIYLADEFDEDNQPDDTYRVSYFNKIILDESDHQYSIEYIQKGLTIIYDIISNLSFDKFNGEFILNNTSNTNNKTNDDWKQFLTMKNVKLDFDDCCVCLESTKTQTQCKHYLCYGCWTQLNSSVNTINDDEVETIKCPYCRSDISY